jgi:sugar lactone lactonase YvrE
MERIRLLEEGRLTTTRVSVAALAPVLLALALSGCMQATNANSGYNYFAYGTLVATNRGSISNYLYYPRGMAVDSAGNIFVVDGGNNRIVEMSSISSPSSSWTSWPIGATSVLDAPYAPEGIAVSGTGAGANIWIADSGKGRILHLTGWPVTSVTAYLSTTGGNAYTFAYPVGLALNGTTLYVTDPGTSFPFSTPVVYEINVGGGFSGVAATSAFGSGATHVSYPRGVAVDSLGNVYVTDETNYRIVEMNSGLTSVLAILGTRGSGTGQFVSPQTIALDSGNNIYVVDSSNYWVVKMSNMTGAGWTRYGVQTGTPSSSVYPNWVAVSSAPSIFVSDDTDYQIAEFQ